MMKKILLMHGANLNFLGKRNPEHYGNLTLSDLEKIVTKEALKFNFDIINYQSNHEGNLIDALQEHASNCAGIIINPGAFSHYSYALHDALLDTNLPVVEVHLSKVTGREIWRRTSVIEPACIHVIEGKKENGYKEAIKVISEYLNK